MGDLPVAWTDRQDGGSYRLQRRDDEAPFGYAVGPHSWKQYQLPPGVKLWEARVDERGGLVDLVEPPADPVRYAFFGARSCELHAMGILDRVLLGGSHPGRDRVQGAFVVAVQCGQAGRTCFCVSMNTGPVAERGFDLALTEVIEDARHYFVVEVGSERGADVVSNLPVGQARDAERAQAAAVHARTASQMGRELDVTDIEGLLYRNYEHPRWDEVADRCLTCGNCTMVCPTCFCTTVEDVTDLEGEHVERHQRWDSCFTVGYIVSDRGLDIAPAEFDEHIVEEHVEHSTALHARLRERGTYLTGPLARYSTSSQTLRPLARDAAREAGLGLTCGNPFQSIIVRAVELVQATDEALALISGYEEPDAPALDVQPRRAVGHGGTEAPGGMLYHRYEIDEDGSIRDARIVPPTSQNQRAIEVDLRAVVAHHLDLSDEQLTLRCEQAIRNHDPCISCSTHFLELTIDRD